MDGLIATVLCSVCLVISAAIGVWCIVNWILNIVRRNRGMLFDEQRNKGKLTPFFLMVIGIFVAAMVMFVPIYLNDLEPQINWATILKIPILSAHNALRLFVVDADFGNVRDVIGALDMDPVLQGCYTIVFSCYYVIAPLLTAAFVLSLIRGFYERWRYSHSAPAKLYIMSELNESSIELAKEILRTYSNRDEDKLTAEEIEQCMDISAERGVQERKIRRTLVFANVTPQFEEEHPDMVEQVREMGAICLDRDITEINLKVKRVNMSRKLYLIGMNEDDNVTKATKLIELCSGYENCNSPDTQIFIFAISEESGIVIDSCILHEREQAAKRLAAKNNFSGDPLKEYPDAFKIKVRRIDEARNLVWNTLLKTAGQLNAADEDYRKKHATVSLKDIASKSDLPYIFQSAERQADGIRDINVLLVGLGRYGSELLKSLCWLCQMPGYRLRVYVFDGAANAEDKFRAVAPELLDKSDPTEEEVQAGEAYYSIKFYNGIDVNAASFTTQVEQIPEHITLAFVTLGADSVNIDTALKLRRSFGKMYGGKDIPLILTAVYNSDKTRYLNRGHILVGDKNEDYRIRFIGDTASRYSLANIQQARLEAMGEMCHLQWSVIFGDDDSSWKASKVLYDYVEYNHVTSMGQAMYLIARQAVIAEMEDKPSAATLAVYEHKRWNAFMRSLGYRAVPTRLENGKEKVVKNNLTRIHSSLVPYDRLPEGEKAKDDRDLEEIKRLVREREAQVGSRG